jgi:hypothetical protein
MALYRDVSHLLKAEAHECFECIYEPGERAPYSGIYRCDTCGEEAACTKGDPLPSQDVHNHPSFTPIGWRLLIIAEQHS